jgi:hypothetical protein
MNHRIAIPCQVTWPSDPVNPEAQYNCESIGAAARLVGLKPDSLRDMMTRKASHKTCKGFVITRIEKAI